MELVEILKALGDENRIRILNILRSGELCVCDIENALGITQSNVSRHLNRLSIADIITSRKSAQWVYYRINEKMLSDYPFINELLENELGEMEQCKKDEENLAKYKRVRGACE